MPLSVLTLVMGNRKKPLISTPVVDKGSKKQNLQAFPFVYLNTSGALETKRT